jgi:hypothetical protein
LFAVPLDPDDSSITPPRIGSTPPRQVAAIGNRCT